MSQSPDVDAERADAPRLVRYRNAWSALSQLIGKGRSFSGHERNCAFLNTGLGAGSGDGLPAGRDPHGAPPEPDTRRFADVSGATGLDMADDGRAIALVDWDFDGDLDMWIANRTAPRVRFLRNDTESGHRWLGLRLEGVNCNRDAIGARVEVIPGGVDGESRGLRYVKTLHAGDGYLSQSSKWIHFGLGTSDRIERVVVSWPGGDRESFTDLSADRRYRLVEGRGRAEPWTSSGERSPLAASAVELPPAESATRTVIVGRVPLPEGRYRSWEGEEVSLDQHRGRALLLTLWSGTCVPCLKELAEWTRSEKALRSAGLDILALCVDGMAGVEQGETAEGRPSGENARRDDPDDAASAAKDLLERLRFPFASGRTLPELVNNLEIVHRTYLELQQPLPIPCSFLLDRRGRLGAIYKGRVAVEQLLSDVKLLGAPPTERRDSAVPFRGRWASQTFPPDAGPIVRAYDLAGRPEAGVSYLRRYIALALEEGSVASPPPQLEQAPLVAAIRLLGEMLLEQNRLKEAAEAYGTLRTVAPRDSALHRDVGRKLLLKGRLEEATQHFVLALQREPENAELLYNFGLAELGLRRPRAAADHFRQALEVRPDDVTTHFHLANALNAQGDASGAVRHFRRALELRPGWPYAANNLAWILATHEEAGIRDGAEAVRIAEGVCRATKYRDHATLATLAAAYAEAGRFAEAVKTNQRAVDIARQKGQETTVRQLLERQESYLANRPFRSRRK